MGLRMSARPLSGDAQHLVGATIPDGAGGGDDLPELSSYCCRVPGSAGAKPVDGTAFEQPHHLGRRRDKEFDRGMV